LARFLLVASYRHRSTIGHFFFWHLQAELNVRSHQKGCCARSAQTYPPSCSSS